MKTNPERIGAILKKAIEHGFILPVGEYNAAEIMFDHNFARAYFGDFWMMHLQKLALAEDRLTYLEQNADTE